MMDISIPELSVLMRMDICLQNISAFTMDLKRLLMAGPRGKLFCSMS